MVDTPSSITSNDVPAFASPFLTKPLQKLADDTEAQLAKSLERRVQGNTECPPFSVCAATCGAGTCLRSVPPTRRPPAVTCTSCSWSTLGCGAGPAPRA